MNLLFKLIQSRLPIYKVLIASTAFSLLLLTVRMLATETIFYAFLVWNLFLAAIPFIITTYLASHQRSSLIKLGFWFSIWLLFLPNAPYIVTDLMHLQWNNHGYLWLDVLVVTSFAWNGLILCFLSLLDMHDILVKHLSKRKAFVSIIVALFLCGFGIYLGRFLRWNSWDIIQHPDLLLKDVVVRFIYPMQHLKTWGVTLGFGGFLNLGFWMSIGYWLLAIGYWLLAIGNYTFKLKFAIRNSKNSNY